MPCGDITPHIQARDASFQHLTTSLLFLPLLDASNRVFHITLVFVLHAVRILALALVLRTVLADDVTAEDFHFGDEVWGVWGVGEHGVDEIFFVAEKSQLISV